MGERLFFHPSLGICILLSMLAFYVIEKMSWTKKSTLLLLGCILIIQTSAFAFLTLKRNTAWKNNISLFTSDIKNAPDNINVITGAASAYLDLGETAKDSSFKSYYGVTANNLFNKGIQIYPKHFPLHCNKAINFYHLHMLDSALLSAQIAISIIPNQPNAISILNNISSAYMYLGIQQFEKRNIKKGMAFLVKSLSANKANDKAWTNMGLGLLQVGAKDKALSCFQSALQLNPQNQKAIEAIKGIKSGN